MGWTREIGNDPPTVTYEEVINSEEGVYEWVKRIVRRFLLDLCVVRQTEVDLNRINTAFR